MVDVASRGSSGPRLLIAPTGISGLPASLLPKRVRVTVKEDAVLGPGTPVRFTALLNPPPAPAAPGAFDFARSAYFIECRLLALPAFQDFEQQQPGDTHGVAGRVENLFTRGDLRGE